MKLAAATGNRIAEHRSAEPVEMKRVPGIGLSFGVVVFICLHLLMGPLFYDIRQLAVLHAVAVLAVGVWWAISPTKPIELIAYVGAYITGSEVLWRIARVSGPVLFYEYAKYLLVALIPIALVVRGRLQLKGQFAAIGYFMLLLPSMLIPLTELDLATAQADISFNLSGPLALMVSAVFFKHVDLSKLDRRRFLMALIGPTLCISSILVYLMITRDASFESAGSDKAHSAHFGPNQVSALLALGSLSALLLILEEGTSKGLKVFMFVAMSVMLVQSALTFSRGGLYMFIGASVVVMACLMKDARTRAKVVVLAAAMLIITDKVVIPRLDELTGGLIVQRFEDTRSSGRDELVATELEVWSQNPIFGVGPGQAMYHRDVSVVYAAAHTEFTRVLAEHGIFGVGSLLLLGTMAVRSFKRKLHPSERALVVGGLVWSLMFMLTAGMRILAPSFLIGLCAATHLAHLANRRRPVSQAYFRQPRRTVALPHASQTA